MKSRETVAGEALQKLSLFIKNIRKEHVELTSCPEVIEVLSRDNCKMIHAIKLQTQNRITLVGDSHLHVEDVKLKRVLDKRKKLW